MIPSRPQASAPWTEADVERGGGDYVLHYDPEAAALVNEDISHLDRNDRHDHVTDYDQQSWTDTTYSEERNDVSAEPTRPPDAESHAEHRPSNEQHGSS